MQYEHGVLLHHYEGCPAGNARHDAKSCVCSLACGGARSAGGKERERKCQATRVRREGPCCTPSGSGGGGPEGWVPAGRARVSWSHVLACALSSVAAPCACWHLTAGVPLPCALLALTFVLCLVASHATGFFAVFALEIAAGIAGLPLARKRCQSFLQLGVPTWYVWKKGTSCASSLVVQNVLR